MEKTDAAPALTVERVQALLDDARGVKPCARAVPRDAEIIAFCRAWLKIAPDVIHQQSGDGFALCGVDRDITSVEEPKAVTCGACKETSR